MLLFDVAVDIAPEKEAELNEWYYTHVPRLMSVPGYDSGRRYLALGDGQPKYRALYEIFDDMYMKFLLGHDNTLRHPRTVSEWADWDRHFVPSMSSGSTGLYSPLGEAGGPLLHGDHPVVLAQLEVEEQYALEVPRIWQEYWLPRLAEDGDVLHASLVHAVDDERVRWLGTSPAWLVVVEAGSVSGAVSLCKRMVGPKGLLQRLVPALGEPPADAVRATAYRPIARHWPFVKEDSEVKFFDGELSEEEEEREREEEAREEEESAGA
jgi:hypothetical protein